MTDTKDVILKWKGPIGIGDKSLPERAEQDKLEGPHVYFMTQKYSENSTVYVGQSKDFLSRLRQHYRDLLGLSYLIRGQDGKPKYKPQKVGISEDINNLNSLYPFVIEDAKRLRTYYAKCDLGLLNPVESKLIAHLLNQFPYEGEQEYWCENGRRQNDGGISIGSISMDYSGLNEADRKILVECLTQ